MNAKLRYFAFFVLLVFVACTKKDDKPMVEDLPEESLGYVAQNDSTVYGLACDGCTDSVLVLLPDNCSDPIVYDIIAARNENRVHGHPEIGDRIAVMLDSKNKNKIAFVVDIDQLKGSWVYEVMPTLRESSTRYDKNRTLTDAEKSEIDSIVAAQMVPRMYGFKLKQDYTCQVIGRQWQRSSLETESPVEYPPVKNYIEWHIYNGKLILTEGVVGLGNDKKFQINKIINDTVDIMKMSRDTLVLQFSSGEMKGYHRQADGEKK